VIAVAGVAAFFATFDVNRLIAPGQGRVKAVTGRDLLIRGGATLEISLHPRLVASDVSISNWPGAGSAPLATAKQVAVQLDSGDVGFRSPAETASGRQHPFG
jgi:uncharacterized protein involved in outer membrane biogenesis